MKEAVKISIRTHIQMLVYLALFTYFALLLMSKAVLAQTAKFNEPTSHISTFPDVTYCIDPDWLPYEAIRNNLHVGMSADYMRFIGIMAEVNFVLVKTSTWEESLLNLKSGKCDVASMLNRSPDREEYLLFTEPYFKGTNVLVSAEANRFFQGYENIGDRRVGAVAGYRQAEYIANYYPDVDMQLVVNESNGLKLLAQGEIDLFMGSLLSINAQIQKSGYRQLYIAGIAEPQDFLSMGVTKNNAVLLNKLDAAIEQIPEWLHVQIYKEWNNVKEIERIDYTVLFVLAGVLIVVVLIGYWRQRIVRQFNSQLLYKNQQLELLQKQLIEKNQSLEFMSMRDPLTGIYNRNFIIERCEQERQQCLRSQQNTCLIVLDIDFFKPINDNYGHSAGDTVLKELVSRITELKRDMDLVSRWGGEEFLILCPNTKNHDAVLLAKRLREAVAQKPFGQVGQITCSFGVAELRLEESFVQWFDRADKALYHAKNNGRNKVVSAE